MPVAAVISLFNGDIKIDTDKVQKWMDLGAEMSDTVRSLMKQYAKKADA